MDTFIAIAMIILGVIALAFGPRLVILGAAVGALLGFAIVKAFPNILGPSMSFLIPLIIAVIFAFGGGLMRSMLRLVTLAIGAVAGASIVMAVIQLFSSSISIFDWILALIGAGAGGYLILRFKDWAVYFLAGLVGALLVVRGLQYFFPTFIGIWPLLVGLVMAGVGVAFQGGYLGMRKQDVV
ncbi:MAG: hypothetical protein B6D41_21190 [Chloroflexi bacterium UTCFX4]|nr:MAG: hypothetical protein B6D41_21190 [Chloroflexi bacterium UTCFX4]